MFFSFTEVPEATNRSLGISPHGSISSISSTADQVQHQLSSCCRNFLILYFKIVFPPLSSTCTPLLRTCIFLFAVKIFCVTNHLHICFQSKMLRTYSIGELWQTVEKHIFGILPNLDSLPVIKKKKKKLLVLVKFQVFPTLQFVIIQHHLKQGKLWWCTSV